MNTWDKIFNKNIEEDNTNNKGAYSSYLNRYKIVDRVVLDIGTGFGEDAVFLSERNEVFATDFSKVAIDYNKKYYEEIRPDINWLTHDSTKPFPFEDGKFDFFNAFLSLHYFNVDELEGIFKEIKRMSSGLASLIYTIKITEQTTCDTGKVFVSEQDHIDLINKHFNRYNSEKTEDNYCGNECKLLTFFINI